MQVVLLFIVNAFNEETVSRKHLAAQGAYERHIFIGAQGLRTDKDVLTFCIYHSYLTDYQPCCCCMVTIIVCLITH